jgi:glycosyltransferase involved in cell wall biosynthesis
VKVDILSQNGGDVAIGNPLSVFPGQFGLVPFWEQAMRQLSKMKSHYNYDLIWLHSPLLLNLKHLARINNLAVTFHTTYFGFYNAFKKSNHPILPTYYRIASMIERKMLREISILNIPSTAVSASVASEMRSNGLLFDPLVIPNGIYSNTGNLMSKLIARSVINEKFGLNLLKDDIILLYFGRLTEQKKPLQMLKFFHYLYLTNRKVHLVVTGRGNLLQKVKREANSHQNIHFLDYVSTDTLVTLTKSADAFISLSCYEGLPLSVLEAATVGLPVILSNIPPHKELLTRISDGIIVENQKDTKKTLDFLYSIKNRSNMDRSLLNEYSWNLISEKYLRCLGKC